MHPVWTHLLGYPIHLYPVMIAVGFVVGVWLAARYGARVGLDRDMILDLCWWLLVAGLVGSRIAFIIVSWDQYWYPCVDFEHFNQLYPNEAISEPDCMRLLRFWNGGLVFYGGVMGAMLAMIVFLRRERVSILPVADALIPSLTLGQFFGRIGCLAAGCCWGKTTTLSSGIEFPQRSMVFAQHLEMGILSRFDIRSMPVHPTQLYDSACGMLLFWVLISIRQRKRYHGQVFAWWLVLYPLLRSLVELFRGDTERGYLFRVVSEPLNRFLGLPEHSLTFLSTSQFISLCVIAVGIALLVRQRGRFDSGSGPSPG